MNDQTGLFWICPECGRQFAKRNQWHSCYLTAVEDHFAGKDTARRETYDLIIAGLQEIGPFRIDAVKGSINLINRYHFSSVTVQKNSLRLEFISEIEIQSPRIIRTERLGPNRVGLSVKLNTPDDVDDELLNWLHKAYFLQR